MNHTQADAIALCRQLEEIAPQFGAHVALTGGTLYKDGARKDIDILFYRIRQQPRIQREELLTALADAGFTITTAHGWVQKALSPDGKALDLFFPDHIDEAADGYGL